MARFIPFIFRRTEITPAEDCIPDKLNQLLDILEATIEIVDAGSGDSVNIGPTTPSPDNTGKPWIRDDRNGVPFGLWQYHDNEWRNMGFKVGDQMWFHGPAEFIVQPWFLADGTHQTSDRSGAFDAVNDVYIQEFRGFS